MRILHCLRAPVGGLFRHVLDLAAEQAAQGHEVGILAGKNGDDQLTSSKFARVAGAMQLGVVRMPMFRNPGTGDYAAYKAVLETVRPLRLDVLHGHGAKGGAYARLAARKLRREGQRVKAFYTPHGGSLNFDSRSLEGRLLLKLERVLERYTQGLIFESAYAARAYEAKVGPQFRPFRIIPNGLQPVDFEARVLKRDATDFLFIGELRDIKGVDVLLRAIHSLGTKRPATATIVGSGPDGNKLKGLCRELNLSGSVRFMGALPAREAFTLGRILVVPSLAESFPYVVLEGAAAGLPIISTSVGGIPEIVDGTDTQLISPGNAGVLEAAMAGALANSSALELRAMRLKNNVQNKFTVAGMTAAVLEFYELN